MFKKAIERSDELTPIGSLAMVLGFGAAMEELTDETDPAVLEFLDRVVHFGEQFINKLDEAGIFD